MAYAPNSYTGNGSTVLFPFSFPYIDRAHVKVEVNGVLTTAFTFANATTIQLNNAPSVGVPILIYRDTPSDSAEATIFAGSAIRASDLNANATQLLYVAEETEYSSNQAVIVAEGIASTAASALATANTALNTSNSASATANNALNVANGIAGTAQNAVNIATAAENTANGIAGTANSALSTANSAASAANNAVNTANSALSTANGIAGTANSALSAANNAVNTANSALSTANGIAGTANSALSAANNAVNTANAALPKAGGTMTGNLNVPSINGGQLSGMRNRIINGAMTVDQRYAGAARTITAGAALSYTVDRWYASCTGANVTGQRVAGATAGQYRFTGASGVTAIGFGQRIEQLNSADLAGTTATLSVDLANSVLTSVGWTAFSANSPDEFGTLASPTRTQIAAGTFTVNSNVTRYAVNISIPSGATNGIEIVFTVGAQTSGTWTIGNVQLEPGTVATPFERRSYGLDLALCQRYFWAPNVSHFEQQYGSGAGSNLHTQIYFPVTMRTSPTISAGWGSGSNALAGPITALGPHGASAQLQSVSVGEFTAAVVWSTFSAEL
jgi:hypothetical protein